MRATMAGRELAYDRVGAGPPLVLLHAFPFDRRMWRDTAAALAGEREVISVDLRGFGESPPAAGPFTIADLADDVAGLLDALGLARAAVAGLSMGGYVALAFAARHAGRLAALILADTKAGPDTPEARQARDEAVALVEKEGVGVYLDKQLPRLLAPSASPALRAHARGLGDQRPEAVIAGLVALRDRPDRRGELPRIACPTLVIVGADDAVTPPAEARAMAAAIPGARLVEIPGAGHLANLEAPAAFDEAVRALAW
jgi:pimeloyl-ACP methyl ester carboxylesterase